MSPVQVTIYDQKTDGTKGNIILVLDASLSETHAQDAEATDHPVEQGANITDHVRPKPQMLTIEGFVSNTPVIDARTAKVQFLPDQPGPAEAAHQILKNRLQAGSLHTVQTKLDTYTNMLLISKNEPRNSQIGDSLQFTLTFKEIRIVFNQTITVITKDPQHQPKTDKGKKVPTQATPTAAQESLLLQVKNAIAGKLGG